jgi:hypothetical protein
MEILGRDAAPKLSGVVDVVIAVTDMDLAALGMSEILQKMQRMARMSAAQVFGEVVISATLLSSPIQDLAVCKWYYRWRCAPMASQSRTPEALSAPLTMNGKTRLIELE